MKIRFAIFILISVACLLIGINESFAEFVSPGKLANAHKKLEGVDNCLKCHSLIEGITDDACSACHEKLLKRIKAKKGFHANVKEKCFTCHTDHKGEKHDIIGLDKEKFNHSMTGYTLQDKHKLDCKRCHEQGNTFLDIKSDKCLNCHIDIHKNTAPEDCISCHDFKGWKTIRFDHDKDTKYKLTGKHAEVKCEPCHYYAPFRKKDSKTGKVFRIIEFKPLDHQQCGQCHYDVHMGQFAKQNCDDCHHRERGWKAITFKHASSKYMGYKLDNKHKDVACDNCHIRNEIRYTEFGKKKTTSMGLFKPIKTNTCSDCHYDVHMAQFEKQDCADCHPINNDWKSITFKHDSPDYTGFKLKGKHIEVICDKCHERTEITYTEFKKEKKASPGKYKPIESEYCKGCHKDGHKGKYGEIASVEWVTCINCHSIESGWKVRVYEHMQDSKYHKYNQGGQAKESLCDACHVCDTDMFCITCCFENNLEF